MKKFFLQFVFPVCHLTSYILHAQNPLFIPPVLTGDTFNLTVQQGTTQFYAGHNTPTYGVNGVFLAPTMVWNKGDTVTLNVANTLTTSTTMHWHGLHVPAKYDGGPGQLINTNTTWSPRFKVMNDAGTYWYHPHRHQKTDIQVSKGLAGMIIIQDTVEAALMLPRTYGIDDFPLIVQTKSFDVLYQIATATEYDTVPMVNGTIDPYLNVPAQVVRLRLLNASSEKTFLFGFSNNMNFYQIAGDGGLLTQPAQMNRLLLANGERAEILVNLSGMQSQTIQLMSYGSQISNGILGATFVGSSTTQIQDYNMNPLNGADYNLLQLNIGAQTANPVTAIPSSLITLTPWQETQANITRDFVFAPSLMMSDSAEGPFTINGTMFNMNIVNVATYKNSIEIWRLINNTLVAHPFHIHDVQFFILDKSGNPPSAGEQGKKDVVLVMPGDTVRFITKFEDFTDTVPYMYHCHVLHHEDDGMMGSFTVLDSSMLSITENNFKEDVLVYPNPTNGELKILCPKSKIIGLDVYNVMGEKIFSSSYLSIDLTELPAGVYFLKIKTMQGTISRKILVIK